MVADDGFAASLGSLARVVLGREPDAATVARSGAGRWQALVWKCGRSRGRGDDRGPAAGGGGRTAGRARGARRSPAWDRQPWAVPARAA